MRMIRIAARAARSPESLAPESRKRCFAPLTLHGELPPFRAFALMGRVSGCVRRGQKAQKVVCLCVAAWGETTLLSFLALPPGGRLGSARTARETAKPLKASKAPSLRSVAFHAFRLHFVQEPGLRQLYVGPGPGAEWATKTHEDCSVNDRRLRNRSCILVLLAQAPGGGKILRSP
jgi:hypothetical protein